MTTKEVAKLLSTEHVSKHKGQFKYWVSYFWSVDGGVDGLAKRVKERIPDVVFTGNGNHFHQFVGGAKSGSAKDSYVWVTFTIPETSVADLPANCDNITKKYLKQAVTTRDLMGM